MENGNAGKSTAEMTSERVLPRHFPPVRPEGRDGPPPRHVTRLEEIELSESPAELAAEQGPLSSEKAALERLGQMSAEGEVPMVPMMPPTDDAIVDTGTVDDENPMTAEDSDKMEKAWAERIQKIIALTKDNPRVEQIEVNKLKADYLKKRFNREIGDRN